MGTPCQVTRKRGSGSITWDGRRWLAFTPQSKTCNKRCLGRFSFRKQAVDALAAWANCVGELTVRRAG